MIKMIELGGGSSPVYHPNFDAVEGDTICDLTEGIPLPNASIEGIYSKDFIEHLTFTDFISLLGECKRVLLKGGKIEFITPDVYQTLFTWKRWNDHTHNVIIGDHDVYVIDWDSCSLALRHKMWFTPELLRYILSKEGWSNIEISEYKKDADYWKEPKTRVIGEK